MVVLAYNKSVNPCQENPKCPYRPTLADAFQMNDAELNHLFNGGLFCRKIKTEK